MRSAFLVVGAGLTGATIARSLADAGHSVAVVERRDHIGGNVFDTMHRSGIRLCMHGPHYFRTSSTRVWDFVNRFSTFYPYEARVLSRIEGEYTRWPVSRSVLARYKAPAPDPIEPPSVRNFESAMLARMPRAVFDLYVREYTEKQWGVPAHALDERLAGRVQVRDDDDGRLTPKARHQGLPSQGYSALVSAMLHGVPTTLGVDYLRDRDKLRPGQLTIFTGAIDEYFGYSLGRLKYRGQRRTTRYYPDLDWYQPAGQVNEPQHAGGAHIRTLEWKHMMAPADIDGLTGTIVTRETPFTPDDPDDCEYPFPDRENRVLYQRYRALAHTLGDTMICGRLGEYRYYDMDQAIARARVLAAQIIRTTAKGHLT